MPQAGAAEAAVDPASGAAYRRIDAIDVIRGLAILGILLMNVRNFALPLREFQRPSAAGGLGFWNVAAWSVADLLFEDKMIALLSLLFGAGLVLMDDHAAASRADRHERFARRWYVRCAWLLLFGLVHAIAVWYGDILNTYAVAGMLLYPVRRWRARNLAWLGVAVLAIYPVISLLPPSHPGPVEAVRAALARPLPGSLPPARDAVALAGSWLDAVRWHLEIFFRWHVQGAYLFNLWRCAGLMLLGMALLKVGFFAGGAERLRRRLLAIGFGVGGACALASWTTLLLRDRRLAGVDLGFDPLRLAWPLALQPWLQYLAGILLGLGHAALIVAWCRSARGRRLQERFAAAGRMALTNYLVQSLVCTALFYGWGFGLFGKLSMIGLTGVVAAIAVAQLLLSPGWLARFTMGPFEWAWRSLTLWRRLPLRKDDRSMGSVVSS